MHPKYMFMVHIWGDCKLSVGVKAEDVYALFKSC